MAPLLLVPVLLLLATGDAFPASCSKATCAELLIQYPFWLHSSSSSCGYPELGLACESNATLILQVQSHRYRVSRIDYATHTITVSDADADGDAGCPRLRANLTIDYASSWLRLTPSDSNITFLYNCSRNASWPSYAVELSGCAGDAGESSYVLPDGVGTGTEAYKYGCEVVVVAPVLEVHRRVMAAPPPANGSLLEVLQGGFELAYNAQSQQCDGCERSGGWCGYRRNDAHGGHGFTCFCDDGPTTGRCGLEIYTSYSCGYTDLNISCQAGVTPTIRLGDDDYTVKNINYSTYTILLADADVPTGGGNPCPRVGRNVSFGTEWLHYTSSQDNLTFFTGCYRGDRVPAGLDAYQINCSPAPGGGVSLVLASDELDKVADEHDLAEHCREVFAVPVLRDSVARGGVRSALPREYGAVLAQGFELAWSPSTVDACYLCDRPESGGGHCAYSQSRAFLGCLCRDGKVGVQDCKNSGFSSLSIASAPSKPLNW
ncbi:hypothetical protein ACP4OV_030281 [Aristida adscensionis]